MTDQMFNKTHGLHDVCKGKNVVDFIEQNFCKSTANPPMLFDNRGLVDEFAKLLLKKDVRIGRNQLEEDMYNFKQNIVSFAGSVQNAARKTLGNDKYELPIQTICVAYLDESETCSIIISLVFNKAISCEIDFLQHSVEYDNEEKNTAVNFKVLTASELELFSSLLPKPSTFIMDVMDKIKAQ